jgi:hypothetical protein
MIYSRSVSGGRSLAWLWNGRWGDRCGFQYTDGSERRESNMGKASHGLILMGFGAEILRTSLPGSTAHNLEEGCVI